LPTFPWLTALGVVGLVALLALQQPQSIPDPGQSISDTLPDNYWILKRESFAQVVLAFLLMNVLIVAVPRSGWANFGSVPEWKWFLSAVGLFLFNVSVHEIGHVCMALLLSHRVHALCIGPFTFTKGPDGYGVQFQPKRLLVFGGYISSVPIHCRHLRLRQVAIVAGGPVASVLGGLCLVAVRLSLPPSEQGYLLFFSWGAVLAFYLFVVSIFPVGYSDGSMLLHLILKTSPGELLLEHLRLAQDPVHPNLASAEPELREASASPQDG